MNAPSILVVEDEALLALDLESNLEDMGWRIAGSLGGVRQTLDWLEAQAEVPNAALLDVNLGGEMVFPVAEALTARNIPYVFATGYADLVVHSTFSTSPVLTKPLDLDKLKVVLEGLLRRV